MRTKKNPGKNTPLAIFFFLIILGAIVLSIFLKALVIFEGSKFKNEGNFSIFVSDKKQGIILSFNKDDNSVYIISIDKKVDDIYKLVEVPIAAKYEDEEIDLGESVSSLTSDMLFNIPRNKSNLNVLDGIRIFLMGKTVNPRDIKNTTVDTTSESKLDSEIYAYFSDSKIKNEAISVEVVNATGEQGVGGRYARLVSNMGGNVVLVSTENESGKSGIFAGDDSYTTKRLGQVLNFQFKKTSISKIADITVVIGKDYKKFSNY